MKYTLNDIFKEQKGFALLTTILSIVLMLILGFTIIWVTTSNFKMIKVDSRSQSAYYVAEAGINYMIDKINTEVENNYENFDSNEAFFEYIENMFMGEETLGNFEKNNGIEPGATVIVNLHENIDIDENTREYEIRSVGEVGNSKRAVSSIIRLERKSGKETINIEDINDMFIYGSSLSFSGDGINGEGGTIIVGGLKTGDLNGNTQLNVTNIYFNGPVIMNWGSASFGNQSEPGRICVDGDLEIKTSGNIWGDVYVNGNLKIENTVKLNGKIYVNGDLKITNGATFNENVYVEGNVIIENTAEFNGEIYVNGDLKITNRATFNENIYVKGNVIIENTAGFNGEIYVNGSLMIKSNPDFNGNVYVNKDLEIYQGYSPKFNGDVYVNGNFNNKGFPEFNGNFYIESMPSFTIPSFVIPSFTIPSFDIKLKEDLWYEQNGYTIMGNVSENVIPDNARLLVDNFYSEHHTSPDGNIVIISKKDIDIKGWRNITGVLFAPNGKVKLEIGSFTGVIISKEGLTASGGGWYINMSELSDFFTEDTLPIIVYEENGSDNGNGGTGDNGSGNEGNQKSKLEIIEPIREI